MGGMKRFCMLFIVGPLLIVALVALGMLAAQLTVTPALILAAFLLLIACITLGGRA